ncbi:MAG: DUF92 domain-containing protein [Candidatus Diapherotrites archaeon]|nr:DUF92 domain-containing protein [Candidatus Diapherotrites archaeon]
MVYAEETAVVLLALLIFSLFSRSKKALDFEGILAGNILGIGVFLLGGLNSFFTLLVFFLVANLATKIGRKDKTEFETRSTGNILGNGAPSLICLYFNAPLAFFGAISAALADTMSSEIGVLSKKKPVLITTLQEVKRGTDGGVTKRGYIAAAIGALIIAAIHFIFAQNIFAAIIVFLAGVLGTTIDSILGAVLERRKILNNTTVNFFGSTAGAILAFAFSLIL